MDNAYISTATFNISTATLGPRTFLNISHVLTSIFKLCYFSYDG
jgi:hypothetical protein